ncbi:Nucleoside-diphosphate-sugar epimerase [Pleurostoma richardsiae]|uniref:Nucleoside-diphosphate-sugar epimerase n=1 Tax=Pleurostoma richardsiae TaxID=41990 RepID=A0AA38VBL9_9PEZI|nr:Nucleoside-diphosphate-sugar epimerase [Pleurostoma richardsiae]
MAPKIFLTGSTGYIGGDVFYALHKAHPDYEYTLLVRNEERGKPVKEKYPDVKLVYGTLDSSGVIEKAAAEADVVVHTADSSDNVPAANAIAKGLAAGHTAEKPGHWVHICGTGILQWYDETHERHGQPPIPEEKYDDIKDIERIINLPDQAYHRNVDKIVLGANSPAVKTAIVGPPTIYGPGRGPVNTRSIQAYNMTKFLLRHGFAPVVGTGKTEWDNVHVHDLADLMVEIVEAALDPARGADPELFGPHGYFFAENGTHVWGEVARWIAEEAVRQGYMAEPKTEVITLDELLKQDSIADPSWCHNSKSVASRARKFLGWKPHGRSLKDEIPDIVAGEAKLLGIEPQAKR